MFYEIDMLKKMPIFKNLKPGKLEQIVNLLRPIDFEKGDILIKENEDAKDFYIILSGEYKLTSKKGNQIILNKPGEFIGWATIIAAPVYLGTGIALTKGEALKLTREDFMQLIIQDSEIGSQIMANGSIMAGSKEPFKGE